MLFSALAIVSVALITGCQTCGNSVPGASTGDAATPRPPARRIVFNEALRTILYLPIYYAKEKGFFSERGLDVEIVTGGTATNAFAAMVSGEAEFAVADPMYVPISRQSGSKTTMAAQIVARIAVWGLTKDAAVQEMSKATLTGKKISTHPRPMTAYTYTVKTLQDFGLSPDKDVQIIESTPGTEIIPLLTGASQFAMTLEPNVSKAVSQGAHVVLSYPKLLGDQIFTGLMTRDVYVHEHADIVHDVVAAIQRAFAEIRSDPDGAVKAAKKYFPQLEDPVIAMAIKRMIDEEVLPKSVLVSEESWDRAIQVRLKAGDIKAATPRQENCLVNVMSAAERGQ